MNPVVMTADGSHSDSAQGRRGLASGTSTVRDAKESKESLLRDSLLITRVDGMHSHSCEDRIVASVSDLPGVKEVEVDFASGQASIIFDAHKVTVHQLLHAVQEAGYHCGDYALGSGGGSVGEG